MKLPIELDVYTRPYNSTAFPLSIIQCNLEIFSNFILENYIQIVNDHNEVGFINYFEYKPYYYWECFSHKKRYRTEFDDKGRLNQFIEDSIDECCYVIAYINEFHIPERRYFEKEYFLHDNMIYGYDDDHYYLLGYNNRLMYASLKIKKSLYFDSFFDYKKLPIEDLANFIFAIQPNKELNYKFSKSKIKQQLHDYVYSINTTKLNIAQKELYNNCTFGSLGFVRLFESIERTGNIDLRFVRLFFEHKKLMKDRLILLNKLDCISTKVVEDYICIEKKSYIIFLRLIKYKVSKKNKSIVKNSISEICDDAKILIFKEIEILREILKEI